ncbi:MAG TPA: DUF1761 domain-containing protein [Candidatus Saccharimonadales bacterium]
MSNLEWLGEALAEVDYLGVLVATVVAMVWGAIWYLPSVAGDAWQKLSGLSKKQAENRKGMLEMFLGAFVFSLFGASLLQALMIATSTGGFWNSALLGALIGMIFTAMPQAVLNLFARKDTQLSAIQGADAIVALALMGGVMSWFL